MPLGKAIDKARIFLTDPVPFASFAQPDKELLTQSMYVRNAIAHRSDHSLYTFRTKLPGIDLLPSNRRYPGPYLRQVFRTSPSQTRHTLFLTAFSNVSAALTTAW